MPLLARDENQVHGLAHYAIDFLAGRFEPPDDAVLQKLIWFHADSVACAIAALAGGCNAPRLLREEALEYPANAGGATCFGSTVRVRPGKAVLANSSAVRELDANGTNFGYNPLTGQQRGEFGHNDYYPVAMAAAQQQSWDGEQFVRAMLCLDEIRGRLAEVFALKDYQIDHVVHGAIASAVVYGAALGASPAEIESAVGLLVAHYIPFRAIRAGHQLSDSKGASAAISSEMAVLCVERARRGFVGPADIFRNPKAIFCLFEPPSKARESPFELELGEEGGDFAVMGMHFKLGLYEHQSAGAIHGLLELLQRSPRLIADANCLESITISIYEPAFGIICDPAKRDPQTRQSADHSMVYIIATLLRKAISTGSTDWTSLMLLPDDYADEALFHPVTRQLISRITLHHGGPNFDRRYPDGIPTEVTIRHSELGELSSGMVLYPIGHARDASGKLAALLRLKFERLAGLGVDDPELLWDELMELPAMSPSTLDHLYERIPSRR